MCNPAIGLVLGLAGGVLQGIGGAQAHQNNANSYLMQAEGLERDIATERESSAYEIAAKRLTVARTQGEARAGYAASGLALSGSAADVLRDSALQGDMDVEAIRWNSANKVAGLKYQQQMYRYNAGQEKAAAPLAFVTPIISGAARFGGSFG